jgi:hypothetical protein
MSPNVECLEYSKELFVISVVVELWRQKCMGMEWNWMNIIIREMNGKDSS